MNKDFKDSNQKTVEAYDCSWSQHQIKDADLPQEYYDELDWLLAGAKKEGRIFELGSGAGDDALYFQGLGYRVDCSEAAPSAVELLKKRGLSARKLNALTDELPSGYQSIMALGVVVHFSPEQLQLFCDKAFAALDSGGHLALSTVEGQIQEWYRDGHGRRRYISHLPEADLKAILQQSGFGRIEISRQAINDKVDGLLLAAFK